MVEPEMGPAERQVRESRIRTMDFNHLGQYSILLGIALAFVWVVIAGVGGFFPNLSMFTYGGLYFFAGLGFSYGVRGYNAAARGLATNRITSVVGIVLTSGALVAETVSLAAVFIR